jgi:uncharacterized LabA/DUF88 family protein
MSAEIVIAYIDGFNLYFGLKEMGWACYYWMNVETLCVNLLNKRQLLATTNYFTSRIKGNPSKEQRQSTFLAALGEMGIKPIYGRYRHNPYKCYYTKTERIHKIAQEKMTDVAIATQLLIDGYTKEYNTALIISGDIDLIPAVKAFKQRFKQKKVIMAFPPMRANSDFNGIADHCWHIVENHCRKSQMPDTITRSNGSQLTRPIEWQ